MFDRLTEEKIRIGSVGIPVIFGSVLVYDGGFKGAWGIIEAMTGILMIIGGVSLAVWRLTKD
jgi:hypothetical protein